ncbi:MAG TPA: molybdopterin-dependent oxidoreductase, partial [Gemmatimonadales bacterium]|nr:molybdopterin-dependent oxidoreductase [Gemmatimonadales bacterium]
VVDLCPVGSLLSKDFLHKARAWELDKTASICPSCSQGCNVSIDTRDEVVVRLRPRPNLDVNRFFMCDHGRANYRWMNRGDRIEAPLIRQPTGAYRAVDWDEALDRVAEIVRGAGGTAVAFASPRASTEALFLARALLAGFEWTGAYQLVMGDTAPLAGVPNLALRAERAPNGTGADLLGYSRDYAAAAAIAKTAGLVLVLDDPEVQLAPAGPLVYIGTVLPEDAQAAVRAADVVLPTTNCAEEEGTFVNRDGRVQRYWQARAAPGMAQPAWWVLGEVLARLGRGSQLTSAADAFERLAGAVPAFAGMRYATVGARGQNVKTAAGAVA